MAQINEMENYEDIKSALQGTISEPYSWKMRPDLRNKLTAAYTLERQQMINYDYAMLHSSDELFRDFCARAEMEEELHQAMLGTLFGSNLSPWDLLVRTEMSFMQHMSTIVQSEQNVAVKSAINYILLDHINHARSLADNLARFGLDEELISEIRELPQGRELSQQFVETKDLLKTPYSETDDVVTKVNLRLARAWEISIRELLQSVLLAAPVDQVKLVCRELSVIENEHITIINSMINTHESQLESAFYDELAEVTILNRMFAAEKEKSAREVYEFIISEDERHLKILGGMLYDLEGKDPGELSSSKALYAQPRKTAENYLKDIASKELGVRAADISRRIA